MPSSDNVILGPSASPHNSTAATDQHAYHEIKDTKLEARVGRGASSSDGADDNGDTPPGCYWAGKPPQCVEHCQTGFTPSGRKRCGDDGRCCAIGMKVLCCKSE